MESYHWMLAGIIVFMIVAERVVRPLLQPQRAADHPYRACLWLLSPAERSFFGVLQQALSSGSPCYVFVKVRLADIVQTREGLSRDARARAWNRIRSKHVDFVICDADTCAVRGVVELDDSSHQQEDRRSRDDFVDGVLEAAEIPVVHIRCRRAYSLLEVRGWLSEMM